MKRRVGHLCVACGLSLFAMLLMGCQGIAILNPQGPVGIQEKDLIVISVILGFIIVVPVIVMTVWFSIRYRESNTKATYKPHWEGSFRIEALIWLVPLVIIVILSTLTWISTKDLDPYKPLASKEPPVHVQVVSLDWNWLFIYPDENVASVNKLVIPVGTPVQFDLTSATVMSSFFIPDLGSQIYAMAGMVTHLNLLSNRPGTFTGENMEFSGSGYAAMHFPTLAVSKDEYKAWIQTAKASSSTLSLTAFNALNKPQSNYPATTYASVEPNLFGHIVSTFMDTRGSGTMTMAADAQSSGAPAMTMPMPMPTNSK